MNDKSFVTVEQAVCPVCGNAHDTGALLLDKRMRKTFEHHTATHYALCPEHKKLEDDGYIALVECSNAHDADTMSVEKAKRTGNVMHIRRTAFADIFNVSAPDLPMTFVELGVIERLQRLAPPPPTTEGNQP